MPSWRDLIAASGLPRSEAHWLAMHAGGVTRAWLIAHDEEAVPACIESIVLDLFARRRGGEPVAYILGEREFYGLTLHVSPAVLIPRSETELLVELALERLPANATVLDVGTGSGAIAIAIASLRPDAMVVATDISMPALEVARRNAARHGVAIEFFHGDALAPVSGRRFDVIVSNPPYVAQGDPHLLQGDLPFEPALALACGPHGMDMLTRLAEQAPSCLLPEGWLLMEHGHDQAQACAQILQRGMYRHASGFADLAGILRVCAGQRPIGRAATGP